MSIALSETWRPIPGWEDAYEVSDLGRVRSLTRVVHCADGRRITFRGRVLSPARGTGRPYWTVSLYTSTRRVCRPIHTLVALAFHGPRPAGQDVRHLDGNCENNAATNLSYGSRSENIKDEVRHGTHVNARKTECSQGHPYTEDNIYVQPKRPNARRCRICVKQWQRDAQQKRRERAARIAS